MRDFFIFGGSIFIKYKKTPCGLQSVTVAFPSHIQLPFHKVRHSNLNKLHRQQRVVCLFV